MTTEAPEVSSNSSTQVEDEKSNTLSPEAMEKEIKALRKENASWRTKIKTHEDDVAKAKEEEAKKRGEYEGLYSQEKQAKEALAAEVETYRTIAKTELDALTEQWSEEDKSLLPSDKSIFEQLTYAKKLAKRFETAKPTTPIPGVSGAVGNKPGKFNGYTSKDEWAEKDPKGFLEYVAKNGI